MREEAIGRIIKRTRVFGCEGVDMKRLDFFFAVPTSRHQRFRHLPSGKTSLGLDASQFECALVRQMK